MAKKTLSELQKLQKVAVKFRADRDWEQFHTPKDVALSLVLEAAEVMEHFQWKSQEEVRQHIKTHKSEIGDELADVLCYLLYLANDLHIELKKAFLAKMKKNAKKYPVSKSKGRHTKYTEL
ncbi:MAG: nucleotide pyrophosphohydrolase [Candidatus Pacebacteria bacterium]|nr:nucleotide pyrophosphohydrolase [Candidatus Paceibacterota bacterium]